MFVCFASVLDGTADGIFERIIETRKLLYALFGQFGRVIDVVHVRREELRGRAWIVYEDVTGAANALRNLQDFPFYGTPLVRMISKVRKGVSDAEQIMICRKLITPRQSLMPLLK